MKRYAYTRALIIKRDGKACFYCGEVIPNEDITLEHLIARSRGGRDILENFVIAHSKCNNEMGVLPLNMKVDKAIKNRVEKFIKTKLL